MSIPPEQLPEETKKTPPILLYILIGSLALVLILVVGILGINLIFGEQSLPSPENSGDDSWNVVKRSGVLLVGTSSGYAPFAFYTNGTNLDGYDVALAYELGKKLGVQVSIQDVPFTSLFSALHNGQIDLAIAAISVTPEREKEITFSNVYYVGSDGILAQKGSGITSVTSAQEMANKRIGVEQSTVFQTWVQLNLVNPSLITPGQMFVYAQAKDAVDDLNLGRLDLVITDLQPAIASTGAYNVTVVGQGLSLQRMAVAMKKNSNALKTRIDEALLELQNEGVLGVLQQQYLSLNPGGIPLPTSTPLPSTITLTPRPTAMLNCTNSMTFVKHLTFDDAGKSFYPDVSPNQAFVKGWRIRNTGTCTWNSFYYMNFVSGTRMNGQPTAIRTTVFPGGTYDVYVKLAAPSTPGRYTAQWRLFNPVNAAFGDSLRVAIEAVSTTTRTPTRTPTRTVTRTRTTTSSRTRTVTGTYTSMPAPSSTGTSTLVITETPTATTIPPTTTATATSTLTPVITETPTPTPTT